MHFCKPTVVLSMALLATLAGCSKSYVDPADTAAAENDAAIMRYNTDTLKAQKVASGLYYVLKVANPTGKIPAIGDEVGYRYKFSTLQNAVIDDSRDTVIYAPFGTGLFIADEPLKLLRVGEYGVFLLPSYLAFGAQEINNSKTMVKVPAYSAVRFDLRLVSSLTEDEQIDQYIASQKQTAEKTTSGVRFIKTRDNATGAPVAAGQTVTLNYTGRLIRGKIPFGSGAAFSVVLGQNMVVPGFEEGIRKMKVGDKATVIFPSSLGYGVTGRAQNNVYVIPPYAPLIFDIEVTSAQ